MATYCLPREFANRFLEELKAGNIDPDKLVEMTSAERRAFFEPIVGKENAQHVNVLFESKLLLKDQQAGLVRWAKALTKIPVAVRRDMMSKIFKMEKILTPSDEHGFLADLAEQKLGTAVTEDEAKKIMELSKAAQKAHAKPTDQLSGISIDALKASDDLKHYVASLKPTTAWSSIGQNLLVTGRNHLLMALSTPIKTTEGQIMNSAIEMVTRRIGAMALKGKSGDLAAQANKEAWAAYRATGKNIASMDGLSDTGTLGEGHNFDAPEGMLSTNPALHAVESGVRSYARLTNKIAIDYEHNITYTKFYQKAFYDGLNLGVLSVAKAEGLTGAALKTRADEIFRDAAKIQPETDAGAFARAEAQRQSMRVTNTNDNLLSGIAMGLKNGLNGGVRVAGRHIPGIPHLGDIIIPIAKIPATIIWNGIENAGVGAPLGAWDIYQSRAKFQSEDEQVKRDGASQFARGVQRLARTFGSIAVGALLTSYLQKHDFRSDKWGNHYVKVFGVWVNTEYINVLSPTMAGMMDIKQHGRSNDAMWQTFGHYISGASQDLKRTPGINELPDIITAITDGRVGKYVTGFLAQRAVPAGIADFGKDRPLNREFFGATGVETPAQVRHDDVARAAKRSQHN